MQAPTKKSPFKSVSASQIQAYRACPRKWYFDKILGVPREPDTPSQALGKEVHAQIEKYIKSGVDERGDIAKQGAEILEPYLPAQAEVKIEMKINGVDLIGYVDCISDGVIIDHKTRSDFKYNKDEEVLPYDEQAIVYGKWYMDTHGVDSVDFAHHNYNTKKKTTKAVEVKVTLTRDEVLDKFQKLGKVVERMRSDAEKDLEEVECKLSACRAYGKQCQYFEMCSRKQKEGSMVEQNTFTWDQVEVSPPEAKKEEVKKEAPQTVRAVMAGLTLCINCFPNGEFKDLNAWTFELAQQLAKDTGDVDIRCSKLDKLAFGKWKAVLAQAAIINAPSGVGVISSSELTEPVIEALSSVAGLVVRGMK